MDRSVPRLRDGSAERQAPLGIRIVQMDVAESPSALEEQRPDCRGNQAITNESDAVDSTTGPAENLRANDSRSRCTSGTDNRPLQTSKRNAGLYIVEYQERR